MRRALAAFAVAVALGVWAGAAAAAPATWQSRIASATSYSESRSGQVSFAVVDESGRLRGYRLRAPAPAASLLKPMLLVAYLRRASVRGRPLRAWERDLLSPMIRRSDNGAAVRMIGLVGGAGLTKLAHVAGMEHFRFRWPAWGQSEVTARGQARFFYRIDSLLPPRHRAYALRLLASVVPSQRWGVGRVAHPGWRLYFKGGWSDATGLVDHQAALYTAPGERFSLAVFTRFNPDHEYGKETLRSLTSRLLAGIPHPVSAPRIARFAADGGYTGIAPPGCASLSLRRTGGDGHVVATGASSCNGFRLALAGDRALWSRGEGGTQRLATASYADPSPSELGAFAADDPLGALAGGGETLAYAHSSTTSVVGGSDCPAPPAAVLAAGFGRIATGAGGSIEVRDAKTCGLVRMFSPGGAVEALALGGDLVAVLSEASAARRIDRYRLSTGAHLGRTAVAVASLPALALRGGWVAYSTPHALRLLDPGSGRTWTVWRPRRAPVGLGFDGRRLAWGANGPSSGRIWLLPLPAGA